MSWATLFVLGYMYPFIEEAVGVAACLFGFGVITIIGAVFGYAFIPETRGKSHDQIMALLLGLGSSI